MTVSQWIFVITSAGLPVLGWFYIIFNQEKDKKKILSLIFLLSTFTAPLFLAFQIFLSKQYDTSISAEIANIFGYGLAFTIIDIIVFVIFEETIKAQIVRIVDKKTILIRDIGTAIKFSLIAGLGFSFMENIYYLHNLIGAVPTNQIIAIYIYRSMFTMCGHLVYSGIFGYYYAMGKFSIVLNNARKITSKISKIERIISNIFNIPLSEAFRQKIILSGLGIAIILHSIQNLILEADKPYSPVITAIFIISCFIYLRYLLSRKTASLILSEDISTQKHSTIAKSNEDVVIELLGLWFNEKRFVDVLHVCERLLERDPDNSVVKLFKARAIDRMDEKDVYRNILGNVLKSQNEQHESDKNKLTNYLKEKEELIKLKYKIRKIIEAEGKKYIEPKAHQTEIESTKKDEQTYNI